MALPTVGSTAAAGSGFIQSTMSPAIAPVKAAGSALGNPLQTLNAPPIVMAGMAAMGTMFGGGGGGSKGKGKGKGSSPSAGGGGAGAAPPPALASGFSGGPEPTVLLESILENTFHLEDVRNFLEDIHKWVGELADKFIGQRQQPKGAVDEDGKKIGGQWMTKRANTEVAKTDPAAKLKAIEERREAERAKGKGKGGGAAGAGAGDDESPGGFLGGGLWALGKGIASLGKGIGKAIQGFLTGVAMGLAAFGNPMVLAGVAIISASMPIVALGLTAMMKVFEHFGTSFEPMKKFIEALEPLFTFVGNIISQVIESLGKAIGHILRPLAEQLQILIPLFDTFMGTLLGFWESLERVMVVLMDSVVEALQILAPTLEKLADVLMAVLPPLVPVIANVVQAVREAIAGIVEIFHVISDTILGVIDGVYAGIEKVVTAIGTQVTTVFGAIKDLVVEVIDSTVGGIERLAALDGDALMGVGRGIGSIAGGLAKLTGAEGLGSLVGLFKDDPVEMLTSLSKLGPDLKETGESLKTFGELGAGIEVASRGILNIGRGIKMLDEADLDDIGEDIVPVIDQLSRILSGPQAEIFDAMKESQLQASEQAAAAAAPQASPTVVNAPSTQINNAHGQTMISAPKDIVRGGTAFEGANAVS